MKSFIGSEQEHLVLLERASQSASKLIAFERRGANGLIEEVAGVQHAVAQIFERGSVQLVGPRGCHDVDLTSGPFSILSAVSGRENVEFTHRFHAQHLPAGSFRRDVLAVGVPANPVDSVNDEPVGFRPLARYRKHIPVAAVERIRSGIGNADVERYQLIEAAAVQRQLFYLLLGDHS
ncbi:MAG: hypothetical protein DMG14_27970 [Acidobacteria bacterium]|nr:MAG: hypothetical protein DMG14_27970 [Acidobacteriota bacterium]